MNRFFMNEIDIAQPSNTLSGRGKRGFTATTVLTLLAVAGCSFQPKYVRPDSPIPANLPADTTVDSTYAMAPSLSYRDVFNDSALQSIIGQGLTDSRNLRIAMATVASVRAQYGIQRSAMLPSVSAGVGAVIGKNGDNPAAGATAGTRTEQYNADISLGSLEIDLFGRLRNLNQAALNEYFASRAGSNLARVTLVSDIATAYLTLAADRSRLAIARETEKTALRAVQLTEARHAGEIASMLDVRQAETILGQARADIAGLITRTDQDRNALELLVGSPVNDSLLPQSIDEIDSLLRNPPLSLSTDILLRRPDIQRAEFQLKAANARIGAARAALFPRVSLSALLGWTGGSFGKLFEGDPRSNIQPSARATIFDGGLVSGIKYTQAQKELFIAQYERTVQVAFQEVSDALARDRTISDELNANMFRVNSANESYKLSDARYRGGLDAFLSTLDAQRQLYVAQQALVATKLSRAINIITLYRTMAADTWDSK